jgi:mono/diheme cytochrome c family protein
MKTAKFSVVGILVGVIATLGVLAAGGLIVVLTGAYDVAATSAHTAPVRWALGTTMDNSVKARAAGIAPPALFTPAMVIAGGGEYKSMCQGCHGGPGVKPDEWAGGMLPTPPDLTKAASDWKPNEIFWILKHGIKMSAMPAFGPTHDDSKLWTITAFAKQLPRMTPAEYAAVPVAMDHDGH